MAVVCAGGWVTTGNSNVALRQEALRLAAELVRAGNLASVAMVDKAVELEKYLRDGAANA